MDLSMGLGMGIGMVSTMGLNGAMGIGMAIANKIPPTRMLVFYYEIR
jgi:hypothetical protein